MLAKNLEKLGLTSKEAKVYLALLELGEANIQNISKKSKVKRTTVYDVIDSLREKGLVGTTVSRKKVLYFAENPQLILNKIEEKEKIAREIMPELMSIANALEKKPKIRFFEGDEGIKEVYLDTLNYPGEELLAWVTGEAVKSFDQSFLNEYYLPQRIKKKIWVRAIAVDDEVMRQYKESDQKFLRKTKLIPSKEFPFVVEINLYGGNKIAIMSFKEKISLIIESQKIYTTLKSIFELQWRSLDK